MNHRDSYTCHRLRTAFVHLRNLLYALLLKPCAQLRYAYSDRVMLDRNLNCIADVVTVTVGTEERICLLDGLVLLGSHGVTHNPRVNINSLAARRFNAKTGVTEPCELNTFQVHVG